MSFMPLLLSFALAATPSPAASPAPSPAPAEEEVPGVDLSDLTDAQKTRVLALLNSEPCPCGCGMQLLECRHKDRTCPVSPGLARIVVAGVKAGQKDDDIRTSLKTDSAVVTLDLTNAPWRGAAEPRVIIAQFCDFQDSACALAESWLKELFAAWPKEVRLAFKNFPEDRHPQARFAAEAAMAAHAQNRFWDLHDRMLARYRLINPDTVREWAKEAGLDLAAYDQALASAEVKARVDADLAEARKVGVDSGPAYFINGRRYKGITDFANLKPVIEAALAAAKPAGQKPTGR